MDIRTGQMIEYENLSMIPKAERKFYVEVKRDLTKKERCEMQIRLYAPCACGSGKKFKFCCHLKPK